MIEKHGRFMYHHRATSLKVPAKSLHLRVGGSDHGHASAECCNMLHGIALSVERREGQRLEVLWDWLVPYLCLEWLRVRIVHVAML
jgi:hypothetical protein